MRKLGCRAAETVGGCHSRPKLSNFETGTISVASNLLLQTLLLTTADAMLAEASGTTLVQSYDRHFEVPKGFTTPAHVLWRSDCMFLGGLRSCLLVITVAIHIF